MKYKVLVFGFTNNIGGVENFFMNYYSKMDFTKFQFDFVTIHDDMVYKEEVSEHGNVFVVENYNKHPLKYYSSVKKIIEENNYDIVHVNLLSCANIIPLLVAKKCKVKNIIAHSHNANIPKGLVRKVLDKVNKKKMLKCATNYYACSKLAGDWMFGKDTNYTLINNKISFSKFAYNEKARNDIRWGLNIKNSFVIGHIGRFSQQKNHEFLIRTFKLIKDKEPDKKIKLLLVGDGELKDKCMELAENLGVRGDIITTGMVSNSFDYYSVFDIFTLPSLFEGLPLVGVEAQISGVKCLFSSNITSELKVSKGDQVEFIDLDEDKWSKCILECINLSRYENTCSSEYDLQGENVLLENYLKLLN